MTEQPAPPEVVTIAATLRIAARWMPEAQRRMLLEAADNTEWYWNRGSCPICENAFQCETGCPLERVRAAIPGGV